MQSQVLFPLHDKIRRDTKPQRHGDTEKSVESVVAEEAILCLCY